MTPYGSISHLLAGAMICDRCGKAIALVSGKRRVLRMPVGGQVGL
jgi:hypothetical protein